jgi:hypothetical protein
MHRVVKHLPAQSVRFKFFSLNLLACIEREVLTRLSNSFVRIQSFEMLLNFLRIKFLGLEVDLPLRFFFPGSLFVSFPRLDYASAASEVVFVAGFRTLTGVFDGGLRRLGVRRGWSTVWSIRWAIWLFFHFSLLSLGFKPLVALLQFSLSMLFCLDDSLLASLALTGFISLFHSKAAAVAPSLCLRVKVTTPNTGVLSDKDILHVFCLDANQTHGRRVFVCMLQSWGIHVDSLVVHLGLDGLFDLWGDHQVLLAAILGKQFLQIALLESFLSVSVVLAEYFDLRWHRDWVQLCLGCKTRRLVVLVVCKRLICFDHVRFLFHHRERVSWVLYEVVSFEEL